MVFYFKELTSTIDEARNEKYRHGDVIVAEYQTDGRGQRGRSWASRRGQNLMLSVVLDTSFLRAGEQFLLLQVVALALVDTFESYGLAAKIKWTNDIYIGDRKITGVLIDHTVAGENLSRSGVGVGINVNQTDFAGLPNATSMALETGQEWDLEEVLERFYENLMVRFDDFSNNQIEQEYHKHIYRLDTPARYVADGEEFTGIIRGVRPTGELMVEDAKTGEIKTFLHHQIGFII